jgi:hypothetical protein
MTEEHRDPIREWAYAQSKLKQARKEILSGLGHTEKSLRELEKQAQAAMTVDVLDTEFGWVQIIPDKTIQWRARQIADDETVDTIFKSKLILLLKDEESG